MPRTAIPLTVGSDAGASGLGAAPDAAGGITPPNSVVVIRNASGASINITAKGASPNAHMPSGLTPPDRVLAVAAGAIAVIGPFDQSYYGRTGAPDVGQVWIDISAVASVTWFAVQTRA